MKRTPQDIWEELGQRDLRDLVKRHATAHQCLVDEVLGDSHEKAPAWARQAVWSDLYALGHWSYPRLAKLFGRDQSTIIQGIRRHLSRTCPESAVRNVRGAA